MSDTFQIHLDTRASLRIEKIFEAWGYPDPQFYVLLDDEWVGLGTVPIHCSSQLMLSFGDIQLNGSLELTADICISLLEEGGNVIILANDQRIFQFLPPSTDFEPAQWDIFIRWVPSEFRSENNVLLQLKEDDCDSSISLKGVRQLVLQQCDWIESFAHFSAFETLRTLFILNCASLQRLQNLEHAPVLQHIEVRWCGSLKWLPDFSSLAQLQVLRIQWCSKLSSIPTLASHPTLRILHISACNALGSLPDLKGCINLHTLYISWFRNTPYFPDLSELPALRVLNLQACSGLKKLPRLSELSSLYRLNISDCQDLTSIDNLHALHSLSVIEANGCTQLEELVLPDNTQLQQLHLGRCVNLRVISCLSAQQSLRDLHISGASIDQLSGLSRLSSLESLYLSDCRPLENLMGLSQLINLRSLQVFGCPAIQDISEVCACTSLEELRLGGLRQVSSLPDLTPLSLLRDLTINWFQKLESLPSLDGLHELRTLKLGGHDTLVKIENLERFPKLHVLDLSRCASLSEIVGLQHLSKLNELVLNDCVSLKSLDGLAGLSRLRTLNLHGCKSLERLPDLGMLTRLEHLDLGLCCEIRYVPSFGELIELRYLDLSSRLYPTIIPLISSKSKLEEVHLENTSPVIGASNLRQCQQLQYLYFLDPLDGVDILIDAVIRREDRFAINSNIDDWLQYLKKHPQPSEYMSRLIVLLQLLPDSSDTNLLWRELIRIARKLGPKNNAPTPINNRTWQQLGFALCQISPRLVHEPIHELLFNLDPYYEATIILPSVLPALRNVDITVQAWLAELIAEQAEILPENLRREFLPQIVQFFVELGYPHTAQRWLQYAKHPHTNTLVRRCESIIRRAHPNLLGD